MAMGSISLRLDQPLEGVGEICISHPPYNHFTNAMAEQVCDLRGEFEDAGCWALVLTSDVPDYFCAHAALPDLLAWQTGAVPSGDPGAWFKMMDWLRSDDVLSVSCIEGSAWGGGAEICWATDVRFASENAEFRQPEAMLGFPPGGGSVTSWVRSLGPNRTLEAIITGAGFDATMALELGLVNAVCSRGATLEAAHSFLRAAISIGRDEALACKSSVKDSQRLTYTESLSAEARRFGALLATARSAERVTAATQRYESGDAPRTVLHSSYDLRWRT